MNKVYKKDTESYCEYTLPDYMGDVKKILTVNAVAIPSGKFVGDGEAEYSGIVSYDLLYSDSEGKLTRLTASSDYDFLIPVDTESYIDSVCVPKIINLSTRLTGPRKLIVKAVVEGSVTASFEDSVETVGTAFEGDNSPELAKKTLMLEKLSFLTSPEREYAEEAERIASTSPEDIEIIATSGAVRVIESAPVENGINVKGEIIITAIVRTDEQPPFAIKKIIPFDETVTFEEAGQDVQSVFDGYLTSVTAGLAEDGDDTVITVNAIAELFGVVGKNYEREIITDAYLLNSQTEASYEEYPYSELLTMAKSEECVALAVPRAEVGCENARNIFTLSFDVRSLEKNISSGGVELSGEIAVSGVACEIDEDNGVGYIPIKFTSPFSLAVKMPMEIPKDAEVEISVSPLGAEGALGSESVNLKCTLKIGWRVTKNAKIKRMKACNDLGQAEDFVKPCAITVYYPDKEESLFEIAKRFHSSVAKIAADNKLAQQTLSASDYPVSLAGVKKLIIR